MTKRFRRRATFFIVGLLVYTVIFFVRIRELMLSRNRDAEGHKICGSELHHSLIEQLLEA